MPCERFFPEGRARLERGEPIPAPEGHFATCPDCLAAARRYQATLDRLVDAGDGLDLPDLPADFLEHAKARAATLPGAALLPHQRARLWTAGLAVAAAVLLGLLLLMRRPPPEVQVRGPVAGPPVPDAAPRDAAQAD